MDFCKKPLLVFWETTKACSLTCRHCRAEAIPSPLPGELSRDEGLRLMDEVKAFGKPYPILILTGGDLLMRSDIFDLLEYAKLQELPVGVSPSVTCLLTKEVLQKFLDLGILSISFSLDGLDGTHDAIRNSPGTWARTLELMSLAVTMGFSVQVNTCAMKQNCHELAKLFALIRQLGVRVWEVFYLVKVGRGAGLEGLDVRECEDAAHFLYDASKYGIRIRTVEGPFFRRIALQRSNGEPPPRGKTYRQLAAELTQLCGPQSCQSQGPLTPTRDGNGIMFIGHDGTVTPGGFLPLARGNVRNDSLVHLYTRDELFKALRDPSSFRGRCGTCEFRDLCGGSRARAYVEFGDPLGEDPACAYQSRR